MSSAEDGFKPGDRVRATFTGTVEWDCSLKIFLQVRPDGNSWPIPLKALDEVELVEPEYIPGEVYQSPGGKKWLRLKGNHAPWRPLEGPAIDVGHEYPARPLRRLVPENG